MLPIYIIKDNWFGCFYGVTFSQGPDTEVNQNLFYLVFRKNIVSFCLSSEAAGG
jgi:hypothetical protein